MIGWIWAILTRLITILVVLAMFSTVSGKFETIVLSALTLIYIAVVGAGTAVVKLWWTSFDIMRPELAKVYQLLNDSAAAASVVEETDESRAAKTKMNRDFWLDLVVNAILWLVAIYHLLLVVTF
jgi:hypothetical protein